MIIIIAMIFLILFGIIFLQHQLLIVTELKNKQELERYIKNDFDKNSYIKIIENKPLKFRRQFILGRENYNESTFNMIYNSELKKSKQNLFREIEPLIKVKRNFIYQTNEELTELELTIYKDDKN
jgi:hypothetical protein